jgi:hypothetical protein
MAKPGYLKTPAEKKKEKEEKAGKRGLLVSSNTRPTFFQVLWVLVKGAAKWLLPPLLAILALNYAIQLIGPYVRSLFEAARDLMPPASVVVAVVQYPVALLFVFWARNHIKGAVLSVVACVSLAPGFLKDAFKRPEPPPVTRIRAAAQVPRVKLNSDITHVLKSVLASENPTALIDFFLSSDSVASAMVKRRTGGLARFWAREAEHESISNTFVDSFGSTPLHICAANNLFVSMRWLVEHGADVNVTNERGLTPLHTAAWHRNLAMVGALLELGADKRIEDEQGRIPAEIAKRFLYHDVLARLRQTF